MKVTEITLDRLREAPWNPNAMDERALSRLRESIRRYGIIENLVVRPDADNGYEVLSGNQRLRVLREAGVASAPCVLVSASDADARLLAEALNHIHGEDDLGRRAEAIRAILDEIPEQEVAAILPDTVVSLKALANMGHETMAGYLQAWEQAQTARLKHLQFQLIPSQLEVVEEALERVRPEANQAKGDNPNTRGVALYLLCQKYLKGGGAE